jgi:molybdenum-dependent DNA-binding transcriptional regulator ModE
MNARPPGRINLKHLHYFHEVAREGSLMGAARRLGLRLGVTDSVCRSC